MRNKSQDRTGRDGNEVLVSGAELGIILRTQRIRYNVLSCPAEARVGHRPPQAWLTSTSLFPGLELLQGFLGSPHWLVEPGQQVPGKFPGPLHNYFTSSCRLQVSRICLLVSFPVLWGQVGPGWRNNELIKSLGSNSITALSPAGYVTLSAIQRSRESEIRCESYSFHKLM